MEINHGTISLKINTSKCSPLLSHEYLTSLGEEVSRNFWLVQNLDLEIVLDIYDFFLNSLGSLGCMRG